MGYHHFVSRRVGKAGAFIGTVRRRLAQALAGREEQIVNRRDFLRGASFAAAWLALPVFKTVPLEGSLERKSTAKKIDPNSIDSC